MLSMYVQRQATRQVDTTRQARASVELMAKWRVICDHRRNNHCFAVYRAEHVDRFSFAIVQINFGDITIFFDASRMLFTLVMSSRFPPTVLFCITTRRRMQRKRVAHRNSHNHDK